MEHQEQSTAQQNAEFTNIERKKCSKCKQEKLITEFYKGREGAFQSQCKKCKREGKRKTDTAYIAEKVPEGMAFCRCCNSYKELTDENFHPSKISKYSKVLLCKKCRNKLLYENADKEKQKERHKKWRDENRGHIRSYSKSRKLSVKRAIPKWFEPEAVKQVYIKAAEFGFDVDHIVPINSEIVCGLHCHDNLQLLDKSINCSKKNIYWPDMP